MKLKAPIHVHWEITNRCNLNCLHCYQQDDIYPEKKRKVTEYLLIAQKIIDCKVFKLTLTGGEPFLVNDLKNIVSLLNRNGITPNISSNGTSIDEKTISWLKDSNVNMQISLDSHRPEIHDALRQKRGTFHKVVQIIGELQENEIPVELAFCATPQNCKDVEGTVQLAINKKVKKITIGEVLPIYGPSDNKAKLNFDALGYRRFIKDILQIKAKYSSDINICLVSEWGFLFSDNIEHFPCSALDRDLAILYNGYVYPCPFIRHPNMIIGDIFKDDIVDIWRNDKANEFRQKKHKGCDSTSCVHYYRCLGGCKAILANSGQPIDKRSPMCIINNQEKEDETK